MDLIDELGFDPVDSGTLSESWRQQPGTPCYVQELNVEQLKEALEKSKPGTTGKFSYQQ